MAQFTNPGFETGSLTGWTSSGSGVTQATTGNFDTPHSGTYSASIQGDSTSDLKLDQTISLSAGDVVTGWYNIGWWDAAPYYAAVRVGIYTTGGTLIASPVYFQANSGTPDYYVSGWAQFTWTAPSTDTYVLSCRSRLIDSSSAGMELMVDDLLVTSSGTLQYAQTLSADIYCEATLNQVYAPYRFRVPIQFSVLPINLQPKIDLVFQVFDTFLLSIDVAFDITLTTAILTIPVTISVHETYQPVIPVRLTVFPTFTSGLGAQGVGGKVVLTTASGGTSLVPYAAPTITSPMPEPAVPASISGLAISWKLSVFLGGVDISARLTGSVSIDAEENAAAVAVFSVRPAGGSINPYEWVKAPVTIDYVETDSTGSPIYTIRVFSGIVDTPAYNAVTRVCQFTCTDNLQNVISNMSQDDITALTPLAQWSKYIYTTAPNGWDYLQQRLETYPYTVQLNTVSQVVIRDWRASTISLEFTEGAIIDQSLAVSLANARDITNQVTASLAFQQDVYREDVLRLYWNEDLWLGVSGGINTPPKATPQMISDAVSSTDALFVADPWWGIQPESQWIANSGSTIAHLNWGDELLAVEFAALVAKRYKQSVKNEARVVVQSSASITAVGPSREEKSGSITVEHSGSVDPAFTASNKMTRYVCTAGGPGLTQGHLTDTTFGNVWYETGNAYPNLPVTFQKAGDGKQYFGSTFTLANYDHLLDDSNPYNTLSGPAGGHLRPGQHIYDFESFIVRGNKAERAQALATVMAQSSRTILASHRQNRIGFATLLRPTVARGDTLRVDTQAIKGTGVVSQIVHNFDIDNGSALSSITLTLSSAKAVGLRPTSSVTTKLEIQTTFKVLPVNAKISGAIGPVTLVGPHGALVNGVYKTPANKFVSSIVLKTYTHTGTVNPAWTGHITPDTVGTFENKEHTFVVDFPEIPLATTENADVVVYGDTVEVNVPQDELFLLA